MQSLKSFSALDRKAAIRNLRTEIFDLVIVGGGITGAGVARAAASRGMKVALLEYQDYAQGTSSRSSKLVHGGIRYLENLEFHLVFEALNERNLLFEMAPHLVHPLRFVLPLYKGGRVGMFKMGLGMWLYDALSLFQAPEMHERLDLNDTLDRLPSLQSKDLMGSYVYSDAYMDDDRLVIETLRSANEMGAVCLNYARVEKAKQTDGKIHALECVDLEGGERFIVNGKHFVGAAGVWTDILGENLLGNWQKILRPSKGVHLVFDRSRIPLKQAVVMAAEKRIVFGIPRHEMFILGTTDTDYPGNPEDVSVLPEDVKYLLSVAEKYFPGAKLTAQDIVSSYAGVRPLVNDGASTESQTSREHLIWSDTRGITFVCGGKYTTYRHMSEQVLEKALENYYIEDQLKFIRGDTKVPLNPLATQDTLEMANRQASEWAYRYKLGLDITRMLAARHGMEAEWMLRNEPREAKAWTAQLRYASLEACHAVENTACLHLIDFYTRRTHMFLAEPDHGLKYLEFLSHVFMRQLGWTEDQRETEKSRVLKHIDHELGWKKAFGIQPRN